MNKFLSGLISVLYIIVMIICLASMGMFVYLKWLAPEKKTELVSNMGPLENVDGKVCVAQVSYYENKDNSGEELFEVKLTGYSDTNAKEIVSFGIQIIGDFNKLNYDDSFRYTSKKWWITVIPTETKQIYTFLSGGLGQKNEKQGKLCFYSETDNLSYKNVDTPFDDLGAIRLQIDGKIYRFSFDCNVSKSEQELFITRLYRSSLSLFVQNIYEKVKTIPIGHFYRTFEFKNMFKVEEFKNNQYENITNQDEVFNYCYIDVNHYTSGAKTATDSIFNQVKYNTNWTINGASLLDGHFSDKSIYYLSQNDCKFTYDETINKHKFDISERCYDTYKKEKLNYILVLDLDYLQSINVVLGDIKQNSLLSKLGVTKYYTKSGDVLTEVTL
mgnify:CR=1 FL=1